MSWTSSDAILYALGVGAGTPDPTRELALTTENTADIEQQVLPTFALTLAQRHGDLRPDTGGLDRSRTVHGEQILQLNRPIPAAGTAVLTAEIVAVYDKGSGAVIVTDTAAVLTDPAAGSTASAGSGCPDQAGPPLFTARTSSFVRGAGGFGGDRGPQPAWHRPEREPDHVIRIDVAANQALIYRLSGDRNRLHSDPGYAARAGFDRPILHGLCTFGMSVRVLLDRLADGETTCFRSVGGRFSKPVHPGERLAVHAWLEPNATHFITTGTNHQAVLDHGTLTLSDQEGPIL